eukprot:scaffold12193_cov51-Attheya_sp.AAC.4
MRFRPANSSSAVSGGDIQTASVQIHGLSSRKESRSPYVTNNENRHANAGSEDELSASVTSKDRISRNNTPSKSQGGYGSISKMLRSPLQSRSPGGRSLSSFGSSHTGKSSVSSRKGRFSREKNKKQSMLVSPSTKSNFSKKSYRSIESIASPSVRHVPKKFKPANKAFSILDENSDSNVEKSETVELESQEGKQPKRTFEFVYPETVPLPAPSTLKRFYDEATKDVKSPENVEAPSRTILSHQTQLDNAASSLLSLEDVLIPAVINEENVALKNLQAKAKGYGNDTAVDAINVCRLALTESCAAAISAIKSSRVGREEEEARRCNLQKEQRRIDRETKIQDVAAAKERLEKEQTRVKALEKERLRRERKKKLPRNVELWKEVAALMMDLSKLQKEERMWTEAERALHQKEIQVEELKERMENGEVDETVEDEPSNVSATDEMNLKNITNAIDDISLSANRINDTLLSLSEMMVKSDDLRKDIYQKYKSDHQFHGYRGAKDPNALMLAFAMS